MCVGRWEECGGGFEFGERVLECERRRGGGGELSGRRMVRFGSVSSERRVVVGTEGG